MTNKDAIKTENATDYGIFKDAPVYARVVGNALDAIQAHAYALVMCSDRLIKLLSISAFSVGYDGIEMDEYNAEVELSIGTTIFHYKESTNKKDPDMIDYSIIGENSDFIIEANGSIDRRPLLLIQKNGQINNLKPKSDKLSTREN